jgi:ABC-type cobalt transport system substrate-binding protein
MRMFGMGVFGVVVMVVVMMMVIMAMVVIVVMISSLQAAHAGAERVTQRAICNIRSGRIGPVAFYVVVMAFLNSPHFTFKPDNSGAVFAQHTSRRRHLCKRRMRPTLLSGQNFTLFRRNLAHVTAADL